MSVARSSSSGSASGPPSTTSQLTLQLQQALAAGDLPKSLEHLSSLLSLSGDNRLKHDLLLKAVELTRHCAPSLSVVAPHHALPLLRCLRLLLVDKEPTLRSQALRVLRYLLTDWHMLEHMLRLNLDLLVVRSLERESKFLWERMQALKFVRKWMAMLSSSLALARQGKPSSGITVPTPSSGGQASAAPPAATVGSGLVVPPHEPIQLTRSLVQSLVAIAEQPKDDFRRVCLDAIRELSQMQARARRIELGIDHTQLEFSHVVVLLLVLFCPLPSSQRFCLLASWHRATASARWWIPSWTPRAWTLHPP